MNTEISAANHCQLKQHSDRRIYVACLASYNAGILHGAWIDATDDVDEMQDAINAMLARSPEPGAEEWAIHDYDFEGFRLEEYTDLETIAKLVEALNELAHYPVEAIKAAWENMGKSDPADLKNEMEDHYQGEYDDLTDYATQYLEDTGGLEGVPEHLQNYIDFEAFGRDLQLGGDIWTHEEGGSVYVFTNC